MDESDVDGARFRRLEPPPVGTAHGVQVWDAASPDGTVFARAEVFPGKQQWGVRLHDRAPELGDDDLLRLVSRLMVWEVGCPAETLDVVLARTHEHHAMVRVGAEYV